MSFADSAPAAEEIVSAVMRRDPQQVAPAIELPGEIA